MDQGNNKCVQDSNDSIARNLLCYQEVNCEILLKCILDK
jgi:hypothetical protein